MAIPDPIILRYYCDVKHIRCKVLLVVMPPLLSYTIMILIIDVDVLTIILRASSESNHVDKVYMCDKTRADTIWNYN